MRPKRPWISLLLIVLSVVGAGLWYAVAGTIEAEVVDVDLQARYDAQLTIAAVGGLLLLAANGPAWLGRWLIWLIVEGLVGALFIAWLVVAAPSL